MCSSSPKAVSVITLTFPRFFRAEEVEERGMENQKKSPLRARLRVTVKKRGREDKGPGDSAAEKIMKRDSLNSVLRLHRREIGEIPRMASNLFDKFRNIQLQEEFDNFDAGHWFFILKGRSKIVEIVAAKDAIFSLAQSGLCAAFCRTTNKRICFLNSSTGQIIRSLFYNKNNDSLITVSVCASDDFSSLQCRTTPVECIKRNELDAGFPIFESESLKWPAFVEFDDVNGKVLTYSSTKRIYNVYDLKSYTHLYSIFDMKVQQIKISLGIMMLIFQQTPGYVPLKLLSIEDGKELKSFKHSLHRNKKVHFIELFNEKLLVKQDNESLQIVDVRNMELTEVCQTNFATPSKFIFLHENYRFLTFRNGTVCVWNFRGELLNSFEDRLLLPSDHNTNSIYITTNQDLLISYCKDGDQNPHVGSINMSNILNGKCVGKICVDDPNLRIRPRREGDGRSMIWSSIRAALEDITALFYDEDRNEIYSGNCRGFIHVWSS